MCNPDAQNIHGPTTAAELVPFQAGVQGHLSPGATKSSKCCVALDPAGITDSGPPLSVEAGAAWQGALVGPQEALSPVPTAPAPSFILSLGIRPILGTHKPTALGKLCPFLAFLSCQVLPCSQRSWLWECGL